MTEIETQLDILLALSKQEKPWSRRRLPHCGHGVRPIHAGRMS